MANFVGIDLGTTNTAIATYDGRRVDVVRSIGGMGGGTDTTSSAIFIDENQQMYIGDNAYRQTPNRGDDVATGFKRLLGTGEEKTFKAANVSHSTEWCSTELLKHVFSYLPNAVRSDPQTSVVITVPAGFGQVKNAATVKAANDAGISNVKLMPEPVAACLAVMRENRDDKKFLIYDLGGGTLDASVADFAGGSGAIVAQGGVEALGGRDWDWAIVNKVVIPWLKDNYSLDDDVLNNDTLRNVLRYHAEVAKIGLSQTYARDEAADASFNLAVPAGEIKIDGGKRLTDNEGKEVGLNIVLSKTVFDQLVFPIIEETIAATKNVLVSNNVDSKSIDYVVFIGGPTLYLPLKKLAVDGLGIPEFPTPVNPMTAVAIGAALYAESLDWGEGSAVAKASDVVEEANAEFPLSLEYEARVTTSKAKVLLTLDNARHESVKVEIRNAAFSTGQFSLNFQKEVSLTLAEDGVNTFEVHVELPGGKVVEPRNIEIVRQVEINGVPVNESISVVVFDSARGHDIPHFLIRAGDQLPARAEYTFKANKDLSKESGGSIVFIVLSGEIADSVKDNTYVGQLELKSSDMSKLDKITKGDSLIFSFQVDEGLALTSAVSVPSIGQTFVMENITGDAIRNPTEEWQKYADEGRELKRRIEQHVQKQPNAELEAQIPGLVEAINVVETSLVAEEVQTAAARIKEIRKEFWNVRKAGIPEQLLARHAGVVAYFKENFDGQVEASATAAEKKSFTQASDAAKKAAEKGDDKEYEKHDDSMWEVIRAVIWRSDWWIRNRLEDSKKGASSTVAKLADEGLKALDAGDNYKGAVALSEILKKQRSRGKQGAGQSGADIQI
jgi:molecular chaperone DnaK